MGGVSLAAQIASRPISKGPAAKTHNALSAQPARLPINQVDQQVVRQIAKTKAESPHSARPFIKWAGGKRQLLPELLLRAPAAFQRYHEPFLGGGALFFALAERGLLRRGGARLADINPELINAYQVVQSRVETLIHHLSAYRNEEAFYYQVRRQSPRQLAPIERAARLIYLNKTCFNGLFRENRRGDFNVPFGHYPCPHFYNPNELRAASRALRNVTIELGSFEEVAACAQPGDFVYFDPPYVPMSRTASFVQYCGGGFDEAAQHRLAQLAAQLGARGVHVLLSNSTAPLARALYRSFHQEEVYARRAINSRGDRRGKIPELLIAAGPLSTELSRRPLALSAAHV